MKTEIPTMTKHCEIYRADRVQMIKEQIGIGQIIKETYNGCWKCLTDTGVIIVKDELKQKTITIYVANEAEAKAMMHGKLPQYLQRKISRNQSKFIRNGKTVVQ